MLSRAVFDLALLHAAVAAGARHIPEKIVDVACSDRGGVVRTPAHEHHADFLLGADGANSLVRKKLARPFHAGEMSIAAGYFADGVSSSRISVRSIPQPEGYLWSFPRPDHLAVGMCTAAGRSSAPALLRQARAWIDSHYPDRGIARREYAWPIPSAGFGPAGDLRVAGRRWILLGDAAGLVDPLTREGIYYALRSAAWASEAIATAGAASAAGLYADRVRRDIYPELARAARLTRLFFSPGFSSLLVTALRESAAIRQVFADLVAGTQSYEGLRGRLLRTREWKLAGRALRMVVQ